MKAPLISQYVYYCIYLTLALAALFGSPTLGQTNLKGRVVDETTRQPLAYVNIGLPGQPVGTLSNTDGSFSLIIPARLQKDSLLFSHLGYATRFISLPTQTDSLLVLLRAKAIQLPTVTVSQKLAGKLYELGNKRADNIFICSDSVMAGSAMALLIENKYPKFHAQLTSPFFLHKAAIGIGGNTFSQFKLRLRFLAWDALTGLPGSDLIDQQIIITSQLQREGWLGVDLSPYAIQIQQPRFFLVVEWLLDELDRRRLQEQYQSFAQEYPQQVRVDTAHLEGRKLAYIHWQGFRAGTSLSVSSLPFTQANYVSFYRTNSQAAWQRSSFILTARLWVSN